MTTEYNKLVRDLIPDQIRKNGVNPAIHIADEEEYWNKLREKLVEEAREFFESGEMEELADVQEVLKAIMEFKGFQTEEVERLRENKAKNKGTFQKRIILEEA